MEEEIAVQLYVAKAKSLPGATDHVLWLIWQHCVHVASIPFGDAVRDPALPKLVVAPPEPPPKAKAEAKAK